MHYQNDQWTLKDDLGLGKVGDQVARMALEVSPPFTIGVTGKWGSGKTSILRRSYATLGGLPLQQPLAFGEVGKESLDNPKLKYDEEDRKPSLGWLKSHINAAEHCRCVWFSPWQHQNEENPLIPLLLEIQQQFSAWTKIKKGGWNITRRGSLAVMTLLERLTDAAVSLTYEKNLKLATGTTEALRKAWKNAAPNLTDHSDGQRFHLLFEDAVKAVLGAAEPEGKVNAKARLIIFIDDLDRCEESVIVRLLEVIKLYLSSNRCVFVLGLDDTAVVDALGRYWQRSEDLNREYLEKLFQARVPVLLPKPLNITKNISKQLSSHNVRFPDKIAIDVELLLEPNPRKVKNFVNGLCAAWAIAGARRWIEDENDTRKFLVFHYIQQYHRSVWRLLERQPDALPFLVGVINKADHTEIEVSAGNALKPNEQRLLMEMFRRAFSHVLNPSQEDESKHGLEDLDSAVKSFIERQDRKRSDEYLCTMLKALIKKDESLDYHYLYAEQEQPQE